jgi:hypothetical protein
MIDKSECEAISGPPKVPKAFEWTGRSEIHKGIPSIMDFDWFKF